MEASEILYKNAVVDQTIRLQGLSGPLMVSMILTSQCQMNCCFCSQGDVKAQSMELSFAKGIMDELADNGVKQLGFTGGEPLLYPLLEEVVLYGAELGFEMSLITNGLLLDKYMQSAVFHHIKVVGVSLHGEAETHDRVTGVPGSYKTVTEGLCHLRRAYPQSRLSLNYTYSNQNDAPAEMDAVIALARKIDAFVNVARINEKGRSQEHDFSSDINGMLDNVRHHREHGVPINIANCIPHCVVDERFRYLVHGCSAGVSFCAIDSDGKVKLCPTADFALGDLHTASFHEIWNSTVMAEFRALDWLPLKCGVCKDLVRCLGACKIDGDVTQWPSFRDSLALEYLDNEWNRLASKRLLLKTNTARGEGDLFVLLCEPLRFCSEAAVDIISKMDGSMTANEIIDFYGGSADEQARLKEFIHALYADKLIYDI